MAQIGPAVRVRKIPEPIEAPVFSKPVPVETPVKERELVPATQAPRKEG